MQTKQFRANVTVKNADLGEVEAVFATLGVVDRDGDIILPGAIKDGSTVAISQYGHSVWKGDPPAGVGTIHEVGDELVVKAQYFLDTDHGRNDFGVVKGLAEAGAGEWSFGLLDVVSRKGTYNGSAGNLIESVDVPEVSPVFLGAGIDTRTLVAKGANRKQFESSLSSLLRQAGRDRWDRDHVGGWVYVWVQDYDVDQGVVVYNIESHTGATMVQVSFERTDTAVTLGDDEVEVHRTVQFLPKGRQFSEHVTAVVADVDALTTRAEEVMALRAAKGKTLGDESADALADIASGLDRLKTLLDTPAPPNDSTGDIDVQAELLRFVAMNQGLTTS